ncbi:L-rhamnonate dehydratase [Sulfolobus sp. A20]|uniref:enolase C-terminal domain-like protein n=1 Tax=Saccharolobus sp. A20 TaxID=1891280 RepID=UPI000845DA78|nr:enolase C-terminal domain-like protein [Sulfolobus sp. A20]AOL17391.1 L-rhamnonate dehydratase [Sulfolobus sp. A20]TRM74265.1 L-rhamnonate dehydratase [Sulfolobus sp. A20-N-F8]TRM79587.1 L-rhamnonate dehydratase [Sulfolobus sp. B5]TRN03967.1 L-rhamnonate dehydratase [Sulfolobus sp. E1]
MRVKDIVLVKANYKPNLEAYPYTKPTDYYEIKGLNPLESAGYNTVSFVKMVTDNNEESIVEVSDMVADIILKLKNVIIGREIDETERIFDLLYRITLPFGRKGIVMMAISAIDLMLWDLKGKETGKPVYKLLGGPTRERIPAYASHLHPTDINELRKEALSYLEEGYQAMKMRLCCGPLDGYKGMERNEELVKAVRDAIGYNVDLMADVWMAWNLKYARRMLKRLERYELSWIEEPLPPDEYHAYKVLSKEIGIPIAAGEHAYTVEEFKLLADYGIEILQPDALWSGGITTLKKVQGLAEAYGLQVIPHTSIPYNLHFLFSCPPHICPMAEFLTKYRWMEDFMVNPPRPKNGYFYLNDKVGFGIEYSLN